MGHPGWTSACIGLVLTSAALPAQLTWRQAGVQIPARRGQFAFFDEPRGRVTVFQGQDTPTTFINDCWQLDGNDWIQVSAATPITPPRSLGAACDDVGGGGLMFGGAGAGAVGTIFGDTLRFDPRSAQVLQLQPATSPPARSATAMACDSARGRVVLFGGADARLRNDTWEWDGSTWTQRFPTQSPSPRSGHVMAYDVVRGCVVLYGGRQGAPLSDTWTYDGTTWTNVSPATGPGAIFYAAMAYDAARGVTVLFGGQDGSFNVNGNTWEWNGTTWTQRPGGPPARALASLTYDKQRRRVTLIGGQDQAGTLLGDAWTWDGTNWTQILPNGRGTLVEPWGRTNAFMDYSDVTQKTVLFGGLDLQFNRFVPLTDIWESVGRVWQQRTPPLSPPPSFAGAGALLRSSGDLYWFPGRSSTGQVFSEQWNWGGSQWSPLTLSSPTPTPLAHQVVGSLQSSLYGWVLVRLVTSGTAPALTSTLQIIQPFSGNVAAVNIPGGPGPRVGSVMVQSYSPLLAPDKVWLFGGQDQNGVYQNDLWQLADTGSGGMLVWTRLHSGFAPAPSPRRDAAMAMGNGPGASLVVTGGADATGTLADSWAFDGASAWRQVTTSGMPARSGAACTLDARSDRSVLLGGFDGVNVLNDIWEFDSYPFTWTRRTTPSEPGERFHNVTVYDRTNRRTLVFSGTRPGSTRVLNDLWSYDGSAWSPVVGRGSSPGWGAPIGCFDERRGAMVLMRRAAQPNWNLFVLTSGGDWVQRAPPPIILQGMVYVASQGVCLCFGGGNSNVTWTYDLGTDQWVQVATTGPSLRGNTAMAYDRLRDRVVLFGGDGVSVLDDTWEYQAATGWLQRSPAHQPQARCDHAMAYDEARGRVVLAGGSAFLGGPVFRDTWEWDGNDWTQRMPETVLPPMSHSAQESIFNELPMTYDPDRARCVFLDGGGILTSLGAPVDVTGRGNTANPEGLRYYSQPVLGQAFRMGFNNPQGLALFGYGFGPMQQPVLQMGAPLCEQSNLYVLNWFGALGGRTEPNAGVGVPNDPSLRGLVLVFQMFTYQPAVCYRATDAINVRFY